MGAPQQMKHFCIESNFRRKRLARENGGTYNRTRIRFNMTAQIRQRATLSDEIIHQHITPARFNVSGKGGLTCNTTSGKLCQGARCTGCI